MANLSGLFGAGIITIRCVKFENELGCCVGFNIDDIEMERKEKIGLWYHY